MNRVVVLMYHALYDSTAELEALDPADRPYAVSVSNFARQLDALAASGIRVAGTSQLSSGSTASGRGDAVLLTFDDGHGSNFRYAYPLLRERGFGSTFFVTSDFIGRRDGFCTWDELHEMARNGMEIQSHGKSHRFLSDLPADEVAEEYRASKEAIERHTECQVRAIAFPGGRYTSRDVDLGLIAGYRLFFTSDAGAVRTGDFSRGGLIRRIPVRTGTDIATFMRLATAQPAALLRVRAVAGIKRFARTVMGNRLYHAIYERLSA